jgi:hypothetical protein
MKRGENDFAAGAETETLPDWKPTKGGKVVQKVGKDSPGVPRSDAEEM